MPVIMTLPVFLASCFRVCSSYNLFVRLFVCLLYMLFLFFFFQAEDGIRDTSVTGVQTCALPICIDAFCRAPRVLAEEQQVAPHRGPRIGTLAAALHGIVVARLDPVVPQREDLRSEEHTSELHHRCISYAVFCLKKKKKD